LVPWDDVSALPFEAAVFPQSMYRWLQVPVVSYAIPALVAIGQARHFHGPRAFWPLRKIRATSVGRTMKVLRRMQPESGGYLEATPLTSFVVMSLAATGRSDHQVCQSGMRFLVDSMDEDGSWPIDTNLATWVTSLSVHALNCDPDDDGSWCSESLVRWHLGCQHKERHPFTGAEPGGWGWTDLSGAVPDSDDTPAAIIASRHFMKHVDGDQSDRCAEAIDQGMGWLRKLQNRDGGWPTFCRGWGKLPFDRSSNDLTAHVIRAIVGDPSTNLSAKPATMQRGVRFLRRNQRADGSWLPLWFGNQDAEDEINPVYGTSRVLVAGATGALDAEAITKGCDFLIGSQNPDGGWGGGAGVALWMRSQKFNLNSGENSPSECSSVEETALAIDALVAVLGYERNLLANCGVQSGYDVYKAAANVNEKPFDPVGGGNQRHREAIIRGVDFLIESVAQGRHRVPWPIGFYFAKLWYHEELYPLIFATTALGNYMQATSDPNISDWLNDT
jgi:squalene-hopene/tetraprenyl-beta-curcumene cyclase